MIILYHVFVDFAIVRCCLRINYIGVPVKIPGYLPVDKIIISDEAYRSGKKIDPKLIYLANSADTEKLTYLLLFQTAKQWRTVLYEIVSEKDPQEFFEHQLNCVREMDKVPANAADDLLDYTVKFLDVISSESVSELYATFKEKKCKKQLKQMDEDTNIQGKMNSKDGTFEVKRNFYENFIISKKIKESTVQAGIKEYGIDFFNIPALKDAEGNTIPVLIAAWLLIVHDADDKPGICPDAQEIISRIVPEEFQNFIRSFKWFLGSKGHSKKMYLAYPICRYADEDLMRSLTAEAPKWRSRVSGEDATPFRTFCHANLYSDTRSAMLFAERFQWLGAYASKRGMDEDTFRDKYLSDVGLDKDRGKTYDLGNQTVTARLQKDLTFLFELPSGKTAKSLPKKGADTDKYDAAKKDFDEMKKSVKRIIKSRCNVLFADFLSRRARKGIDWKGSYLENPLLHEAASLLVWSQNGKTFTLTDTDSIDSSGQHYDITDEDIIVAHPMEMDTADLAAWQKYYTDNKIKQPFLQLWEPAYDPKQIKEDRYKGCVLNIYQFSGKDKHGIHAFGVYAWSDNFGFELDDCELEYEADSWKLTYDVDSFRYTLGKLSFKEFTRRVNHIIMILDKMTVYDRIKNDDVSVIQQMDSFTVAQIIEFISIATEAKAINVTAELLQYRHDRFPDYDPLAEFDFTLDL